jgi:hypothetical protein
MKYSYDMLSQYIVLYLLRVQKTPFDHLIKTLVHK